MSQRPLRPETPLRAYKVPEIGVECLRCQRTTWADVGKLARRFGDNLTVGQLALKVAEAGSPPCALATTGQCSARPLEPPVWFWANLGNAYQGGWRAYLYCRRELGTNSKKGSSSCPERLSLDVETLVSSLGYDMKLDRLASKLMCPKCHGSLVEVEWSVPDPTPAPFAPPAVQPPVQLRPNRAQLGRTRLRVVDGDKAITVAALRVPTRRTR